MKTTSGLNKGKSISLVSILLLATLMSLVTIPTASAINETHLGNNRNRDMVRNSQSNRQRHSCRRCKIDYQCGTTINIPAGKHINVGGSICAGDAGWVLHSIGFINN